MIENRIDPSLDRHWYKMINAKHHAIGLSKIGIYNIFKYKKVLYIGAGVSYDRFEFVKILYPYKDLTIIEPNSKNVDRKVSSYTLKGMYPLAKVIRSYLINVRRILGGKKFELGIWWHGPEHIPKRELLINLTEFEKVITKFILLGGPNPYIPQGRFCSSPMYHWYGLGEIDWEKLGYNHIVYGKKNRYLIAWKNLEK